MSTRLLITTCIALASTLPCPAGDDAPIDRITAAQQQHESDVLQYREELRTAITNKRKIAQEKGDLASLQRIDEEIAQFEKHNKLPQSVSTAAYSRKMALARSKLISAYQLAIKELTKSGDIETAKAVQGTLDRLKSADVHIPRDAVLRGGFAFKAFSDQLTWEEAEAKCMGLGGRLVRIESLEENEFVTNLAKDAELQAFWLDISDRQREGTWFRIDGSRQVFVNWDRDRNQPNNARGIEHHAVVLTKNGKWWDYPNAPRAYPELTGKQIPGFICQWDLE